MSQENVEIIARLYDEFLAKPERLASPEQLAFFDPAVEMHQSESILGTRALSTATTAWDARRGRSSRCSARPTSSPSASSTPATRWWLRVEFRGIGKEGGVRIARTVAHVFTSEADRSSPGTSTWTRPKPSKPWGCRSSRH